MKKRGVDIDIVNSHQYCVQNLEMGSVFSNESSDEKKRPYLPPNVRLESRYKSAETLGFAGAYEASIDKVRVATNYLTSREQYIILFIVYQLFVLTI